jgi:RNA polymerase sigma-70 factor (ECF subfamily)
MNASIQRTRDAWLALRCQSGEAEAYRQLVVEFERPLLYFAAKLLGSQDAALDVLQQTWLRALRGIRRLARPEQLRPWLYQVVRGLVVDHLRKRASDNRLEREYAEQNTEIGDEPTFDAEDAAALHLALDEIDVRLREVLVLHFLEVLPIADVAAIVGCPEGTVKSRLHHGKRALAALLREKNHAKPT